MRDAIACWTAESLLPLLEDGPMDPEVRSWLEAHAARCPRHAAARWRTPPALDCDPARRDLALTRILEGFDEARPAAEAPSGWLGELLVDWRAAPVPMTALSLLALAMSLAG